MKIFKIKAIIAVTIVLLLSSLQSCYSVIVANKRGLPVPDPVRNEIGFYAGKEVITIDTTIKLPVAKNYVIFQEGCAEGGFHSVEYRATLGGVLLSGITLGKVRKVKVRYTCLKEKN